MPLTGLAFEWDLLARILGLAASAGLNLPVLLILPWILDLSQWINPSEPGALGGLDSFALALMGLVLLAGWLVVRRLPYVGTAFALLLAGAGVVTAALLPWLLVPATGDGIRALESLAAIVVSGSIAAARMGWRFVHAHPPATLPGSESIRRRGWSPPGLAAVLVVGTVVAPGAAGVVALGLLFLALWPGRGALRASRFALGSLLRLPTGGGARLPPAWALEGVDAGPPRGASAEGVGARGMPAALLGYGGGGLRPGWLIAGIEGDDSLCFRYRTPMGAWDLDLGGADTEEIEPGPLVQVRSITREGACYVLLLPPAPTPASIRSIHPVPRNL